MPLRLKTLELHGFKTFANRTLFEFAGSITAIVGPNGSGKSNITDSVRWVLGEQSFGLLRAKKTEDMIFSGSESRSRLGMATGTITFDNTEGWLPIDFNEVSITRRAYRDGNNEYLLNGQKVRLKDIVELLSQSGLSERNYTVIGQGLIDAVLSLRVDERRRLFEEAAGIGLYRSRKEEALRRIEHTIRNLERVEDILLELKPRLASLERQARRAQEYEQVRSDLLIMLKEWYGFHWHAGQKDLAEAQKAVRLQEVRLEESRNQLQNLDEEQIVIQSNISSIREQLSNWYSRLSDLNFRREGINRVLAVAGERQQSIISQNENIERQLAAIIEETTLIRQGIEDIQEDIDRLDEEKSDADLQFSAAQSSLASRAADHSLVEVQINKSRYELSEFNSKLGQLLAWREENRLRADQLENEKNATIQKIQNLESQLLISKEDHKNALRLETTLQDQYNQYLSDITEVSRHVAENEIKHKKLIDELADLQSNQGKLVALANVLEQAENALTGYAFGTRILIRADREKKLIGVSGTLNNFIDVQPEYEKAILAALGEYLDAVVLDRNLESALDLLQESASRGVLLPLDRIRTEKKLSSTKIIGEGIIGVAADLVHCDRKIQQVIELLLGNVIIVEDRQSASRALRDRPNGVRVVTLRGEVFHAAGPVSTIGEGGADIESNLISRDRKRHTLEKAREQGDKKIEILIKKQEKSNQEIERSRDRKAQLELEKEKIQLQILDHHRQVEKTRAYMFQVEQQLEWNNQQINHFNSLLLQNEENFTIFNQEITELNSSITDSRNNLIENQERLKSFDLDEFQVQVAHWQTRLAVIEQATNDANFRMQERTASFERSERIKSDLEKMKDSLRLSEENLKKEHEEFYLVENEISRDIDLINQLIKPAEIQLRDLESEEQAHQKITTSSRQTVSNAEHFFAQSRINLARRQDVFQTLKSRIEDDFGLVDFEYDEQISGPTPLPLEGMVEQLPVLNQLSTDIEEKIKLQRAQLRRMGPINAEAISEYDEVKQRFDFMTEQVADLHAAESDLQKVIIELDSLMVQEFRRIFEAVAQEFRNIFTRLFSGGTARLVLTEPDNLTVSGIDIETRLPGRRMQGLALLSGGERSLTAAALVFALLKVSPTPFCVLDEVDAMLDETNIGRYRELLSELSQNTQFIIVTHNRNTVQVADIIYGVTMDHDSTSQVLSLRLEEIDQLVE